MRLAIAVALLSASCSSDKPPFFCASAGTAGLCEKEKAICEAKRAEINVSGANLGECVPTLLASCFAVEMGNTHEACFPTEEACNRIRSRWVAEAKLVIGGPCETKGRVR